MPIVRCGIQFSWDCPIDCESNDTKCIGCPIRKKNIKVQADLDIDKIQKIDGVENIEKNKDEYTIKIVDSSVIDKVFKEVSKCKNVTKFSVEEPTLNEIFVSKVGEAYEK